MTYRKRVAFLMLVDSAIVLTAIFISNFLLAPLGNPFTMVLFVSSITLLISHHIFAYYFKLYKKAWQYASISELIGIFKAVTISIALTAIVQLLFFQTISLRTLAITWMMHILFIGGSRFSWRLVRDRYIKPSKDKKNTLIIGAGAGGTMVARQLQQSQESELQPVAFIDDDLAKQNLEILDLPVVGGVSEIEEVVKRKRIEQIIIAIPSLSREKINYIFNECAKTKAKTQILPVLKISCLGKFQLASLEM